MVPVPVWKPDVLHKMSALCMLLQMPYSLCGICMKKRFLLFIFQTFLFMKNNDKELQREIPVKDFKFNFFMMSSVD